MYKTLRQLTRERGQLIEERTTIKNQLHAEQAEAEPNKKTISCIKKRIELLNKEEKEIRSEIEALIKEDKDMKHLLVIVCSLPGVGLLTSVTVLAETNVLI